MPGAHCQQLTRNGELLSLYFAYYVAQRMLFNEAVERNYSLMAGS